MIRYLLLCLMLFMGWTMLSAQSSSSTCVKSTEGTDFWFGFMESRNHQAGHYLEVTLSSIYTCNWKIYLGNSSTPFASGTLSPNTPYRFKPDWKLAEPLGSENIDAKALHLVSDNKMNIFAMNWSPSSADAAVIFPVDALGNEYYAMCYEPHVNEVRNANGTYSPGNGKNSEFLVVASEDNTTVTITPTKITDKLKPANVPFTITLSKGQLYQVQSMNHANLAGQGDLTGSYITSDKPVAFYSGSWSTTIPVTSGTAYDHLYEQIPPVRSWGRKYVTAPLKGRTVDYFRVIASEDGTNLRIGAGNPIPLTKGVFYEFTLSQATLIESDKPILLAQFMASNDVGQPAGVVRDGDPLLLIVSPVDQTRENVSFVAYDSPNINSKFFVNVVCKDPAVGSIYLDGTQITFQALAGSGYSYAQIAITKGNHTLLSFKSGQGFIAYVYGYGGVESYGYGVGFNLSIQLDLGGSLAFAKDTIPLCAGQTKVLDAGTYFTKFKWNTGETTQSVTASKKGWYKVTATTPDGCNLSDSIYMYISDPTVTLGKDTTGCNPKSITLDPGTGYTSYLWSTNETSRTIKVSKPGTYTITTKNKYDCPAKGSVVVSFVDKPKINLTALDTLVCGTKTATVKITVDKGKFLIKPINPLVTTDGLNIKVPGYGTYPFTFSVTDPNFCTSDTTFSLGFHESPNTNLGSDTTICNPKTLKLDAGAGHTSYLWSTKETTPTITVKTNGIYSVTTKNKYSCTTKDTIKVDFADKIKVDLSSTDTLVCGDISTLVKIKAAEGAFILKSKDPLVEIVGLSATVPKYGTYPFILTPSQQATCFSDTTFKVSFHEAPIVKLGNDTAMCNTKSILLNAGAGNSSYLWSTKETTPTIQAKQSGIYSVLVKNKYNCSASDTIKIGLVDNLKINLSSLDTLVCGSKTTKVNINAEVDKYKLVSKDSTILINGMTATVSKYGTYLFTMKATDQSACYSDTTFKISFRDAPILNLGNDTTLCNPRTLTLDAGAGFTSFLWSTKDTTRTILVNKSGVYSVFVRNKSNCFARDTIKVGLVNSIKVDFSNLDTLVCGVKATTLNLSGDEGKYILKSKDSTIRINGLSAVVPKYGTYPFSLLAKDQSSCYSDTTFSIRFSDAPTINLGNDTTLCSPNAITLNAGPGFTSYLWSTNETTPSILVKKSGIYNVLVKNGFNCSARDTINIGIVNSARADLSGMDTVLCGLKTTTVKLKTEVGKYVLTSKDQSINIVGRTATVPGFGIFPFALIATDKTSCFADTSFNINFRQPPTVNISLDTTTCQGYSFDAKYSGNADVSQSIFTWIWAKDTVEYGLGKDGIHVQFGMDPANSGLQMIVDERGCVNQSAIQQINMKPGLNFTVSDTILCDPSVFSFSTVSTKNVVDYLWDWGDGTVEHLTKSPAYHKYTKIGHYSVQLTASTDNNCVNTVKKNNLLYFAAAPKVVFSMKDNLCLDIGSHILYDQGTGSVQDRYIWDLSALRPGDMIQNPGFTKGPLIFDLKSRPSAKIGLQVISKEGCTSEKKSILVQRNPVFTLQTADSIGCVPFLADLNAVTSDSIDQVDYVWNFGEGRLGYGSKGTHTYLIPDQTYNITLFAKSKTTGCLDTLFKPEFIKTLPKPTAAFNVNRKILSIENPIAVFNNQSVYADNFIWNFDDGSVSRLKSPTHRYESVGFRRVMLEAINEFGCSDTISVIVTIPLNKIYAPNAFSPNALNADDRVFLPYCFGVMKRGYHLKIVNRWNEIIYEVKNEWKGWDGRMPDGSLALAGNYVWILYFEDFMGEYHYQSGTVLLMY